MKALVGRRKRGWMLSDSPRVTILEGVAPVALKWKCSQKDSSCSASSYWANPHDEPRAR